MLMPALFSRKKLCWKVGVMSLKKPAQLSTVLWNLDARPHLPCGLLLLLARGHGKVSG